jgi:poly-gamma-glutamate synthesis protein (capsule biosynthesis protein)
MKLLIAGDVVVRNAIKARPFSEGFNNLLNEHPYRWFNFEAPIAKDNTPRFPKKGPTIKQEEGIVYFVEKGAFNLAGLANNHIMDYGAEGLKYSQALLDANKVRYSGAGASFAEAYQPLLIEAEDVTLSIIAVGEAQFGCLKEDIGKPGYAWCFNYAILDTIRQQKELGYTVIVMPHAGLEGYELPLPEWRALYKRYIDEGADLVICTHPHIIQGKEQYKNKWIYYSLGNLFFNEPGHSKDWYLSVALSIEVGQNISITEHVVEQKDDVLHLVQLPTLINERSQLFSAEENDKYYEAVTQECVSHWAQTYKKYYGTLVPYRPSMLATLARKVARRYFRAQDELMILHNIRIETHRYAVERALSHLYHTY